MQAVLFDMDGVISDTQKLHSQVESHLLARYGINIAPDEITRRYAGVRTRDIFADLLSGQPLPYDLDALLSEKRAYMLDMARQGVQEIPGSVELIKRLHDQHILLAVASSSHEGYVMTVLESLQVASYFQVIVTGDSVKQGKPNPECYLLAAKRLGVEPSACIVIEDALNGMMAAINAGMTCIALLSNLDQELPTTHKIHSYDELTDRYLTQLSI